MNSFDSIRLDVPFDVVKDFNIKAFTRTTSEKNGQVLSEKLTCNNTGVIGFNGIQLDQHRNKATIDLSSKVLHQDYYRLINSDTVEQAFDNLSQSPVIDLDTNVLLDFATCRKLDVTKNLRPSRPDEMFNYISALKLSAMNDRWRVEPYKPAGIECTKLTKDKRYRQRLIMYEKLMELAKDKAFKGQPYFGKLFNEFQGTLRAERNLKTFAELRNAFGVKIVGKMPFHVALQSETNPLLDTFDNIITASNEQLELFIQDHRTAKDLNRTWIKQGIYYWFEKECQSNLDKAKILIYALPDIERTTKYRIFSKLKNAVQELNQVRTIKASKSRQPVNGYVNEIRSLLVA